MVRSRYEKNIQLQSRLIEAILEAPLPPWMPGLRSRRLFFAGVGSSFHAAQIAARLWRQFISPEAWAEHSFDFARSPQPAKPGDVVALFSHRGTKSFTVEAARKARGAGATTVGLTGMESPWRAPLTHRLETCEPEDCGAFTKSLTTTLAWVCRWIGEPGLLRGLGRACAKLDEGPRFPGIGPGTDLVLLGDGVREWVARETALKLQETAYVRARPFGLEEFLHGPRLSVSDGSLVAAFSSLREERWGALRRYLKTVGVPLIEVQAEAFGVPPAGGWLWQLFWGQRLALDACRRLGIDPDSLRTQERRYKRAREALKL